MAENGKYPRVFSVRADRDVEKLIDEALKDDQYRNPSHIINMAVRRFLTPKTGTRRIKKISAAA